MKEFNQLQQLGLDAGCRKMYQFEAGPVDESDLLVWEVHLFDFCDEPLASDMKTRRLDRLTLRVHFPDNYPNAPPFVHMLRPRLKEGTGYVFNGGGICMELLTPQQWSPATSINALIMSVRAMLIVGKAALRTTAPGAKEADYCYADAARDFKHIVDTHKKHGWTSHPMFKNS